jgi:hypothetical protein
MAVVLQVHIAFLIDEINCYQQEFALADYLMNFKKHTIAKCLPSILSFIFLLALNREITTQTDW